jgi:hypothetical protein
VDERAVKNRVTERERGDRQRERERDTDTCVDLQMLRACGDFCFPFFLFGESDKNESN